MDSVPSGSYLVISHGGSDLLGRQALDGLTDVADRRIQQKAVYRTREQVARFFDGTDLAEPVHRRHVGRRGPRMAGPGRGPAVRGLLAPLGLRRSRRRRGGPPRGPGRPGADAGDRRPLRARAPATSTRV